MAISALLLSLGSACSMGANRKKPSSIARFHQPVLSSPAPDRGVDVTGQAKIRICIVSEAQSNVEGIARLGTLASDRNTGSGIVVSRRCADAQQVIG